MLCQCEANNNFIADLKIKIYYLRNKTKAITLNKKENLNRESCTRKRGEKGKREERESWIKEEGENQREG